MFQPPTFVLMRFQKGLCFLLLLLLAGLAGTQTSHAQRRNPARRYEDSVAAVQRAEKAAYIQRVDSIAGDSIRQHIIPLHVANAGTPAKDELFITKPARRTASGQDTFFYIITGLLFILGLIRAGFPKYFSDLFKLFFRVTFRQQSIREQLLQNTWPSLLLNMLFFVSGGLFLTVLSQYYGWALKQGFWYNLLFWSALLAAVYGFKLLVMQSLSWLFHLREAGKTYTFIVFLMNKVIGVLLLPFIVFLGLGPLKWRPVVVTLALVMLAGLFLYRYLISYPSVKATVRLNRFHFIMYLWALEIVPLLLIYKGLALQLSGN
jgi:hypothetical protein